MRKNHSKIVCIKLVHLPYLYTAQHSPLRKQERQKTEPERSVTTNIFELMPSEHMSSWVTPKRPTSVKCGCQ